MTDKSVPAPLYKKDDWVMYGGAACQITEVRDCVESNGFMCQLYTVKRTQPSGNVLIYHNVFEGFTGKMHVYSLGMGSDEKKIVAPDVEAAVFYYFFFCINANVPLVMVYTEDDNEWKGDSWWAGFSLGSSKMTNEEFSDKMDAIKERFPLCHVLKPTETNVPFETYMNENI